MTSPNYTTSRLPPKGIYEKCQEKWGVDFETTVFTYGNTIHSKQPVSDDLLAHELTHVKQQTETDKDVWWHKYFEDPAFRFQQELEAYRNQYKWILAHVRDRNAQARGLLHCAKSLSGSMYGNMLTLSEALKLIKADA